MKHIKHIWPTIKEVADDLGVPYTTAHSWSLRGRIPSDYDFDLILAAKKRGKKLTLKELAEARHPLPQSDVTDIASSVNAFPARQPRPGKPASKGRASA